MSEVTDPCIGGREDPDTWWTGDSNIDFGNNHIPIMLVIPQILSLPQSYRNCDVLDFQKLGSLEQRTTKVPPSL
jgi:hypothetical protein